MAPKVAIVFVSQQAHYPAIHPPAEFCDAMQCMQCHIIAERFPSFHSAVLVALSFVLRVDE
jgi:hypothetical protein